MPDRAIHCDVCVIGSGAGGAPAAFRLAKKGLKVLLLERGNFYSTKDFYRDELDICRRDFFFPAREKGIREIHYGPSSPMKSNHLWTGSCVGGGTVRMSGFFFRMGPQDFSPVSNFGAVSGAVQRDWPIGYSDLEKYYDEVERLIGISAGTHPTETAAAERFSNPPLKAHPFSGLIDSACRHLGYRPFPTPRAILSRPDESRGACNYSGFCGSYGCTTGAKSSALVTFVPQALKTGNLKILANHYVHKLESRGNRVTAAHFYDGNNKPGRVQAQLFILACSSIESARLLLNSRDAHCPQGLANSSGQVGKNLTFQMPCSVTGFFSKSALPASHLAGSPFVQRSLQDFHILDESGLAYPRGGTVVFLLPHPNPIQRAYSMSFGADGNRIYGHELKTKLRKYFEFVHLMSDSFLEFLPNPDTRVSLSQNVRDFWKVPSAKVSIQPHPANLAAQRVMAGKIREIFLKMGATKVQLNGNPFTAGELQHGTCRFGENARDSVLNPACRAHDIKNLYVTDASFMPSGLPVPSTFTIMANSLRVADGILKAG